MWHAEQWCNGCIKVCNALFFSRMSYLALPWLCKCHCSLWHDNVYHSILHYHVCILAFHSLAHISLESVINKELLPFIKLVHCLIYWCYNNNFTLLKSCIAIKITFLKVRGWRENRRNNSVLWEWNSRDTWSYFDAM